MNIPWLACFFAILLLTGTARALPYEGTITPGISVTGSVSGFGYIDEDGSNVDFWTFMGTADSLATIRGTRLVLELDPAFSLYFGVSAAPETSFRASGNFGGLLFLSAADDEVQVPGPFGDPLLRLFRLPFNGTYTVAIGGSGSDDVGPYPYALSLQLTQVVPIPITGWLVLTGLAILAVHKKILHYAGRASSSVQMV